MAKIQNRRLLKNRLHLLRPKIQLLRLEQAHPLLQAFLRDRCCGVDVRSPAHCCEDAAAGLSDWVDEEDGGGGGDGMVSDAGFGGGAGGEKGAGVFRGDV